MSESTVSSNILRDSMLTLECQRPYLFRVIVGILPAATLSGHIELVLDENCARYVICQLSSRTKIVCRTVEINVLIFNYMQNSAWNKGPERCPVSRATRILIGRGGILHLESS